MTNSLRSSKVKKNNTNLRKRVFGPVEQARNERLNAKLMSLASQPKPSSNKMDVEDDTKHTDDNEETRRGRKLDAEGEDMDVDGSKKQAPRSLSVRAQKKIKEAKREKIEKKKHRKAKNEITFKKHPKKSKR